MLPSRHGTDSKHPATPSLQQSTCSPTKDLALCHLFLKGESSWHANSLSALTPRVFKKSWNWEPLQFLIVPCPSPDPKFKCVSFLRISWEWVTQIQLNAGERPVGWLCHQDMEHIQSTWRPPHWDTLALLWGHYIWCGLSLPLAHFGTLKSSKPCTTHWAQGQSATLHT